MQRLPASDPRVAAAAYKGIRNGWRMESSTTSRSLMTGKVRKEESRKATKKIPPAPKRGTVASIQRRSLSRVFSEAPRTPKKRTSLTDNGSKSARQAGDPSARTADGEN